MTHELMQFFKYDHLLGLLQETSKPFCELAKKLDENLTDNSQKTSALEKLLESKDCAVRSVLMDN